MVPVSPSGQRRKKKVEREVERETRRPPHPDSITTITSASVSATAPVTTHHHKCTRSLHSATHLRNADMTRQVTAVSAGSRTLPQPMHVAWTW